MKKKRTSADTRPGRTKPHNSAAISSLKAKSFAVGSGKGGVGKSTTALNLAVYYAKLGIKTALCDLDPLSNIATILDLSDERLANVQEEIQDGPSLPGDYTLPVFTNLDLLFPKPKLKRGESAKLLSKIFASFAEELNSRYDLLVYDLPAGIGQEENLSFLPFTNNLLVVTNAEPTSHVSAGGYIKAALEVAPNIRVFFWHNKYSLIQDSGFNPRQVIENYNRYVQEELRLDPRSLKYVKDIAFIPHEASLDLLQSSLSLEGSVRVKLLESCDLLQKKLLSDIPDGLIMDENSKNLIKHYVARRPRIPQVEIFCKELEEYYANFYRNSGLTPGLGKFLEKKKMRSFSGENKVALRKYIRAVKNSVLRERALRASRVLEGSLEEIRDNLRGSGNKASSQTEKIIHEYVTRLLKDGAASGAKLDGFTRNLFGILLFNFALSKVLNVRIVQSLIFNFVPKRKNSRGVLVRDKNKQINYLVERDELYHAKYFSLIKALFPVVMKQLAILVKTFGFNAFVLRTASSSPKPLYETNRNAYLKLLTNFVHDAVHAGLGVFIGFKFNTASESIKKGAKALLDELGIISGS
ncbi:MAG: P-loop NTPase [Spirochaetales bacterium]|jgi:flagellar biosynthesis protein FlhG|nr:P-loop NTPase [Spirochaetales bacterium]